MKKLLRVEKHLADAIEALDASEDNSPEMFLLGELKRAKKRVEDRIKAVKDALGMTAPSAPAGDPGDDGMTAPDGEKQKGRKKK